MTCDVNCKFYPMCWNVGEGICEVGEDCDRYEPERPHGEWVYEPKLRLVDETDDGAIYETAMRCFCSVCNADFGFRKMDDAFCRFCGADMREGEKK